MVSLYRDLLTGLLFFPSKRSRDRRFSQELLERNFRFQGIYGLGFEALTVYTYTGSSLN